MAQEIESSVEPKKEIEPLKPKKRKKKKGKDFDPNAWMVTFSDLITLMMTFFVLLFSFNEVGSAKLESLTSEDQGLLNVSKNMPIRDVQVIRANSLTRENLEVFLSESQVQQVEVSQTEEGLLVTIPSDILFARNSHRLPPQAVKTVRDIAGYLAKTQHIVRIEGHAAQDFRPSSQYPDAWSLSLARAGSVLREFVEAGVSEKRMSLNGRGNTKPKYENAPAQDNRRVEIVIMDPNHALAP